MSQRNLYEKRHDIECEKKKRDVYFTSLKDKIKSLKDKIKSFKDTYTSQLNNMNKLRHI